QASLLETFDFIGAEPRSVLERALELLAEALAEILEPAEAFSKDAKSGPAVVALLRHDLVPLDLIALFRLDVSRFAAQDDAPFAPAAIFVSQEKLEEAPSLRRFGAIEVALDRSEEIVGILALDFAIPFTLPLPFSRLL